MTFEAREAVPMVTALFSAAAAYGAMRWRIKSLENWKAKTQVWLELFTGSSNPGRGPAFVTPQQCDERTAEIRSDVKTITRTTNQLLNVERHRLSKEMSVEEVNRVLNGGD